MLHLYFWEVVGVYTFKLHETISVIARGFREGNRGWKRSCYVGGICSESPIYSMDDWHLYLYAMSKMSLDMLYFVLLAWQVAKFHRS